MQKSISLLLAILPFAFYPYIFSPYELPKTWLIALIALLSVGSFLLKNKTNKTEQKLPRLFWLVIGLWVWLILTSAINGNFWQSWQGNVYRQDGLRALSTMILLGLTVKINKDWLKIWGYSGLILSIWTIWEHGKSALFFGNVNFLAGYLAITLPFAAELGMLAQVVQIIAVGLTGSWGALLAAAFFVVIKYVSKNKYVLVALLTVISLVIGGLYYHEQYFIKQRPVIVAESRDRIWAKALIAVSRQPVLGWGWSQFGRAFSQIDWPEHYQIDANVERTHASLTEYGIAGGIPALIMYLLIAVQTIWVLLRSNNDTNRVWGMVVLLYIIQSQTNVTSIAQDYLFWIGVGAAAKLYRSS